jgi:nitroimidazol reductase NimA-like FMN-containing flavoprotein (pyridoxamine 5'-phosphate oxidase superfamily)
LEKLTRTECRNLLGRGGIGRIVFYDPRGPVALPVNYRMAGDDIVFRTAALSSLRGARYTERVSFEVDHIDDAMRQGWSVLVTGSAREVHDADELRELEGLGVEPWAGEERPVYLRIEPKTVSGRRIRVPAGSA